MNKDLLTFKWEDDKDIGYYELTIYDENYEEIMSIHFTDNTCKFQKAYDEEYHCRRYYSFEIGECNWGRSWDGGFDYYEDCNKWGYNGVSTHTVEDVKRWCESYAASKFIIDYEAALERLNKKNKLSQWLINKGYSKDVKFPS